MLFAMIAAGVVAAAPTTAPKPPALAIVFHVAPPASDDAPLAAADVGLRAPEEVGELLAALRLHPGAHLSLAVTPAYLAALDRAAKGETIFASAIRGGNADDPQLLGILERHRPLDPTSAHGTTGLQYLKFAGEVAAGLTGGPPAKLSRADTEAFAEDDAMLVADAAHVSLLSPQPRDAAAAFKALEVADLAVEDELRADLKSGSVELVAIPDDEPLLPLLVDAGGKTIPDPRIVAVGAKSDAQTLSADAVRACGAFASTKTACGFYSPYGAYDDSTAAMIKDVGASFALFSDRVLRGAGGQGTASALEAARTASLHAYALTVDRGVVLPTLFWVESSSDELDAAQGSDGAMAGVLQSIASDAADASSGTSGALMLLRVEADGPWAQVPDAQSVADALVSAIASGRAGRSTTVGAFVRSGSPAITVYGYPPGSEEGSLDVWTHLQNQLSLWKALAAARTAAGGDAALHNAAVRGALIEAESGRWFSMLTLPLPQPAIEARLDEFRALLSSIYADVHVTPPATIAPVKFESPSPVPSAAITPPPATLPKASPAPSPTTSPGPAR